MFWINLQSFLFGFTRRWE